MQRFVFKISDRQDWEQAQAAGRYAGSADDARDGFIHFSSAAQVEGTLEKHFAGQSDLVLACIDTSALDEDMRWEVSSSGKAYPHLYADLPFSAVVKTLPIHPEVDGETLMELASLMAANAEVK
ncbi:DUF952 domain-containing protein [Tepidamorphus sp. 3E244]|uniref:DUF952 domain-containing protein n=1 Tax=Tepidamorphus sp. 3E244 TaxID=3385498 RepID=UPI0038FC10B4